MATFKDKKFDQRLSAAAAAKQAALEKFRASAEGKKKPLAPTSATTEPHGRKTASNEASAPVAKKVQLKTDKQLTFELNEVVSASQPQSSVSDSTDPSDGHSTVEASREAQAEIRRRQQPIGQSSQGWLSRPNSRVLEEPRPNATTRPASKPAVANADIHLPPALVESVRAQRAILFLGAGASWEAIGPDNRRPPLGGELKKLIAEKFFGQDMSGYDLMSVAEMAIASHGDGVVYDFIRGQLEPFPPSEAHKLIPTFRWRMLATTNYDLIIERAYNAVQDRTQSLVKFVKDSEPVEERLQKAKDPVVLLKLHGCLEHMHDSGVPIVLSHEHYNQYSTNRIRLFGRLSDLAHESPIIFCGYGIGDAHIRSLIYKLAPHDGGRPAYYMVSPTVTELDQAFWAKKNVEVIKASFGDFMNALDAAIPSASRKLKFSQEVVDQPIRRHYRTNATESEQLRDALSKDFVYVRSGMEYEVQEPKKFYEGYDTGWGGIIQRLDVGRKVVEDLLYKAVIDYSGNDPSLFILKGPAGNGKTIALKRAAWEAATSLDQLVLFMHPSGALDSAVFRELHDLTGKRIYLFVDRVAIQNDKVAAVLKAARQQSVPLTVVAAERDSEWNVYCGSLQTIWRPTELRVGNLSRAEIENLIDALERHKSLGLLEGKPRKEQVDAFYERADRQLLVALHETTRGKKFEDIVFDEYQDIVPEHAQRLYLDICTLNQFGVPVRAGTISRVSSIRFEDYKREFFLPLENVVLTSTDPYTGDFQYKARHSRVAALVFNQACANDEAKADQLIKLIEGLDIGFSVDRYSLVSITRGRSLALTFSMVEPGRSVYRAAAMAAPDQAFIYQQWAIFESSHPNGSLSEGEVRAQQARALDQRSKSIIHTQAEISRKRANSEANPALRDQLRRQARERINEMRASNDRFAVSTRCKLLVDEIEDLVSEVEAGTQQHREVFFADKVKDAETALERAMQAFPDDSDFLEVEARLRSALGQKPKAINALERAWVAGPRGAGVAIRLSRSYDSSGDASKGEKILRDALEKNPDDKAVHYAIAKHMLEHGSSNKAEIERHLAHSYGKGDTNFEARSLHAQYILLTGDVGKAFNLFQELDDVAPPDFLRYAPRRHTLVSELFGRPEGVISKLESSYALIKTSLYPKEIVAPVSGTEFRKWDTFSVGTEVSFIIYFDRAGPVAFEVERRSSESG